jgi:catechol 2,3-dioxygenase-like lactoylglutathione lyase family enzyme
MIDYQDLFHVGVRVPDLDAAAAELGESLGVTWAEVRESAGQQLWTPEEGAQEIRLRYTYSAEGPQHIELLEGAPGSFWDGNDHPGAHHVGVWVDDVGGDADRLVGLGWALVGAHRSPEDGYGVYSYLQPPSGLIVELVDRAVLPHFEAWWAAAAK